MKIKIKRKKEVLSEAAKGPRDLPENAYISVFVSGDEVKIQYTTSAGYNLMNLGSKVHGTIEMSKNMSNRCVKGVWIVKTADAAKGWGPMLYEVAIEYASKNGKGLTSDRMLVSKDAKNVYDYYANKRSDVKKDQMDITKSSIKDVFDDENKLKQLTPDDPSDDCNQVVSMFYAAGKGNWRENHPRDMKAFAKDSPFDNEWHKQSLSKILTKQSPVVSRMLKKKGKLRMHK